MPKGLTKTILESIDEKELHPSKHLVPKGPENDFPGYGEEPMGGGTKLLVRSVADGQIWLSDSSGSWVPEKNDIVVIGVYTDEDLEKGNGHFAEMSYQEAKGMAEALLSAEYAGSAYHMLVNAGYTVAKI